jgi:hypothetical protein
MAIAARSAGLALLFAAVFIFAYLPVIVLEQQHLLKLFPEYADYAARVPILVPLRKHQPAIGRFRWQLYWKNQEYQALLGFAVGLMWLFWKAGK